MIDVHAGTSGHGDTATRCAVGQASPWTPVPLVYGHEKGAGSNRSLVKRPVDA